MNCKILKTWKNSDTSKNFPLYIRAFKGGKFQTKLRKWKVFQWNQMNKKNFRNWKNFRQTGRFPRYIQAFKCAKLWTKSRSGIFSSKMKWSRKFIELEKFPRDRRIFHFIPGPLIVPSFRSNREGGNVSNKIRRPGKFPQVEKF